MIQSSLFDAALSLSEADKVRLVERLLESLGPETDGIDEDAFRAELDRRSREVDEDPSALVPWSELKKETW